MCRIGLQYLNTEKPRFFLEVRDPSIVTDPHVREKRVLIRAKIRIQ